MRFAYGMKSDAQLVGAPGWLKTEHFDIQAKASDADVAAFNKLRGFDERNATCYSSSCNRCSKTGFN